MELRWAAAREGKLLSFLRRELRLSAGLCKRLKYDHAFAVNGTPVYTDHPVRPGDIITVRLSEPPPEYPAEPGPLDILYEDEALLAVDKPAGLMVHPSAARNTGTLANRLAWYYAESGQACRIHPVTRLDRDTLGVVLLAKHAHFHDLLMQDLAAGAIRKTYQAWVWGGPAGDSGLIDAPIARPDPLRMARAVAPEGKPAQTRWRVLRREANRTLLELQPLTGRTHQLRVHCLWMGWPMVGDPQYATPASAAADAALGLRCQLLCAARLELRHPLTGATLTLRSRLAFHQEGSAPPALPR